MTGRKRATGAPARSDRTTNVRRHYDRWPFPGVNFLSREGMLLLRSLHRRLDPEKPSAGLGPARVADVGCGTGETVISLARHFPRIKFLGVDIAGRSLTEARLAARRSGVRNVTFRRKNFLEDDLSTLGTFRVVLCLGVLHHTPDLRESLKKIIGLAEPDGLVLLWLYSRFGRSGHQANQRFLKVLARGASAEKSLALAKDFLRTLGARYADNTGFYTPKGSGAEGIQWLLAHPQWLADQMIPATEQSVTMEMILSLFEENGLRFMKWLGGPPHLRSLTTSRRLLTRFDSLPSAEQLIALDCLVKPSYYFIAAEKRG